MLLVEEVLRLLKCPKQDALLEYFSIPDEISFIKKTCTRMHLASCSECQERSKKIQSIWKSYFKPEPEITSSLLSVYSRLQRDETLILKGWKLGETKRPRPLSGFLFNEGWLFRGAVSFGLFALLGFVVVSQMRGGSSYAPQPIVAQAKAPLAQIRVEDKNTLKVHYLEPQLLQTIEFETTRGNQ